IRKVTAQRAENNQKNYKKDNFYIISIEIVFFHLSRYFMSRTLLYNILIMFNFICKCFYFIY
ncbi:IS5/IS1182 family transposase, partial [Staphylococcus hominis]